MMTTCFAFKLGLFTNSRRTPASRSPFFYQMRTDQMQSVFAEPLSQFIGNRIEVLYLFRLRRMIKKGILHTCPFGSRSQRITPVAR